MQNGDLENVVEDLGQSEVAPLRDKPESTRPRHMIGNVGFGEDGEAVPFTGFDYGSVRLNGEPSESETESLAADSRLARAETVIRTIAFLADGAKTPEQLWRRVHLIEHWLRPVMEQRELARKLAISPQAVSAALDRLRAEIRHFFTN